MARKVKSQYRVQNATQKEVEPRINTTYRIRYLPFVPNAIRNMPFTLYPVKK